MNAVYRDIAKMVHPDMNGGSSVATARMQEVNKFKNSPGILLRLAQQWGLKLNGSFDTNAFDRKASEFSQRVYNAVVGAIITDIKRYNFGRHVRTVRGVIIKVRSIKSGKHAGWKEWTVFDFTSGKPYLKRGRGDNPFTNIVGMADIKDFNMAVTAEKNDKDRRKIKAKTSQDTANKGFDRLGLKKNKKYGNGVEVLVKYRGGSKWKELDRTTAKSVYVYENARPRRIPLRAIAGIRGEMR